jgi:alkylation response protein AidB-like acyl-CoA dehydrogenase
MHTNALTKPELIHRALLHLVFGTIHLLGRSESLVDGFDEQEKSRLRLLTPVVKSFAAELSTTEMPDLMASLGGQGYMVENQFAR